MTDLRATLNVAARTRQQFGATEAQINYICKLAAERGIEDDYASITTLTKRDASIIIDTILNPVDVAAIAAAHAAQLVEEAAFVEDLKAHNDAYAVQEAAKAAWIAAHYPDYEARDTKGRKRIRAAANKAIAA